MPGSGPAGSSLGCGEALLRGSGAVVGAGAGEGVAAAGAAFVGLGFGLGFGLRDARLVR